MTNPPRSPVFWLAVAVAFVVWAQWDSTYQGQLDVWRAGIRNCQTSTQPASRDAASREADLLASERDQAVFARGAEAARKRQPGFAGTANLYAGVADRSDERVKRARARAARAAARAAVPCSVRWPKPHRQVPLVGR